jgi:hypothetical protein
MKVFVMRLFYLRVASSVLDPVVLIRALFSDSLKLLLLHLTTPDFKHVISDIEIIWNDFRHELRLSIHYVSRNE